MKQPTVILIALIAHLLAMCRRMVAFCGFAFIQSLACGEPGGIAGCGVGVEFGDCFE